jgi:hypothetical protein
MNDPDIAGQEGGDPPPPPPTSDAEKEASKERTPPPMALRTYRMLRLCSIGVIALLAISIILEYNRPVPNCLQSSISAYYFTGVQTVFVGTLLSLGLVMIVLWGKTSFEDGVLNLAGLVAPVVAFAPTGKPDRCGLETAVGVAVTTERQKQAVINAATDAVDNNILAYLILVGVILGILAVIGMGLITKGKRWTSIHRLPGFWQWVMASLLFAWGIFKYVTDRNWYYDGAHTAAAITLFIFIVLVVINIGWQKWAGVAADPGERSRKWASGYWALATVMVVGAVVIFVAAKHVLGFQGHWVLWLESWMIGWLAVFWLVQTMDRWHDGAPRR